MYLVFWLLLGLVISTLLALVRSVRQKRSAAANFCMLLLSAGLCLWCGETMLIVQEPKSDGAQLAAQSRRWWQLYWHPVNAQGYRDYEWTADTQGSPLVIFVGDSFTAGVGIKKIEDTFAKKFCENLGRDCRAVTLAVPGWGPPEELQALRRFPRRADLIFVQYFINDIANIAGQCGEVHHPPGKFDSAAEDWLVRNSFLYGWMWRTWYGAEISRNYYEQLHRIFSNERCLALHLQEVLALVQEARTRADRVAVIVFPLLFDLEFVNAGRTKLIELLRVHEFDVIDIAGEISGMQPIERVVSKLDQHPSLKVHAVTAGKLADFYGRSKPASANAAGR